MSESYLLCRKASDSSFAGGTVKVEATTPGDEERISFSQNGKEVWHALVPTAHGRNGWLREHRFFPIAEDHLLVSSHYEHTRGGHTNAMVLLCNTQGVCCTERLEPTTPMLVVHKRSRAQALYILDRAASPSPQPVDGEYLLGTTLRAFSMSRRGASHSVLALRTRRELVHEVLGVPREPFENESWTFPIRFEESKSGAIFIEVTSPPGSPGQGRMKLALDDVLRGS